MPAEYYAIRFDEMHPFLANQGFKWLNPPRNRPLPTYVTPETVVNNPPHEFYGGNGKPPTLEAVFGRRVFHSNSNMQLTLRIYTTIDAYGAREKGEDAIRITVFQRPLTIRNNEEIALPSILVSGERKCLRVKNWQANLQKRIDNWPEMMGPLCPKCNSPMVERTVKRTGKTFWGCTNFRMDDPSSCRGSMEMGNENKPHCHDCGSVMVERSGPRGRFLGCTSYPRCRATQPLPAPTTA